MSVLVSTAYMDEAERFDWLVAMDAGRVLATGTAAELRGAQAPTRWKLRLFACCRKQNGRDTGQSSFRRGTSAVSLKSPSRRTA